MCKYTDFTLKFLNVSLQRSKRQNTVNTKLLYSNQMKTYFTVVDV